MPRPAKLRWWSGPSFGRCWTPWGQGRIIAAVSLSSDSLIVAHLALPFVIEFGDRLMDGQFEMLDGLECPVGEEVALEVAPGALDVVQFGRVFWQPLDSQPGPHGERGAGQLADVDRAVVEHQHDWEHLASGLGSVTEVKLLQQSNEIAAALAG